LDELGEKMKAAVEAEVPATFVAVSQPIEDRVNQLLAGSRADVVIKVFGNDLTQLKATADQIGQALRAVPGVGDLRVPRGLGWPRSHIHAARLRRARSGPPAEEVLQVVEASRVGVDAGIIFEGPRRFPLKVLLPPATLAPESFGELQVGTPSGELIPLAS